MANAVDVGSAVMIVELLTFIKDRLHRSFLKEVPGCGGVNNYAMQLTFLLNTKVFS